MSVLARCKYVQLGCHFLKIKIFFWWKCTALIIIIFEFDCFYWVLSPLHKQFYRMDQIGGSGMVVSIEACHSKGRRFKSRRCQSFLLQLKRQREVKNNVKRKRRTLMRSGSEEHVKRSTTIGSEGTWIRNEKKYTKERRWFGYYSD